MIRENTERETVSEETVTVTEYIEYQRNQSEQNTKVKQWTVLNGTIK